ncbi:MAG: hypothetical protein QW738_00160 [Nitrososphaeria archaeon]
MASLAKRLKKEYLFGKLHGLSLLETYFKKCVEDNLILSRDDIIASANAIIEMAEDDLEYCKSEYEELREKDPVLARDACSEYAFNLGIKKVMHEFKKRFQEYERENLAPFELDRILEVALTVVEECMFFHELEYEEILEGERKRCKKIVQ